MDKPNPMMAQQIARAALEFERETGGHLPTSVTVVLGDDTLVIKFHGALTPAEKLLAASPAGAAQVQEFHRELFAHASDSLRREIEKITGVEVCEAAADVAAVTGTAVKVFMSGTIVRVFLLNGSVPVDSWKWNGSPISEGTA